MCSSWLTVSDLTQRLRRRAGVVKRLNKQALKDPKVIDLALQFIAHAERDLDVATFALEFATRAHGCFPRHWVDRILVVVAHASGVRLAVDAQEGWGRPVVVTR